MSRVLTLLSLAGVCSAQNAALPLDPSTAIANPTEATNFNPVYGSVVPRDAPYVPLTMRQRLDLGVKQNITNPFNLVKAIVPGAMEQLSHEPQQWPLGLKGYAYRSFNRYGRTVMGDILEAGIAAPLQQEERYIFCKCTGIAHRSVHAVFMNFVTYNKDGKYRPFVSRLGGTLASEYIGNLWYPEQGRTNATVLKGVGIQLMFGGIYNLVKEFSPEWNGYVQKRRQNRHKTTK